MQNDARIDLEKNKKLLKSRLLAQMPAPGEYPSGLKGLTYYRRDSDDQAKPAIYNPVLIVVAQGAKWIRLGDMELMYGENDCFIAGVELPAASCIMTATSERPFLSLALDLDKSLIAQIAAEVPPQEEQPDPSCRGGMVYAMDAELLDAVLRLSELTDTPKLAASLAPLITKEIHCRLLTGPFGNQLRSIYTLGSQGNQIVQAISWLRKNFAQPLQIDDLARQVNMATSTFHKHFKEFTALSPLQYQKRLRLAEAQRLMLVNNLDATQACLAVGYESSNQFNREYKKLFGEPPFRDVSRIRESGVLNRLN